MAVTPDLSGVPLRLSRPVYRYHQYQGNTNDCGPTSVAIAVNALLGRWALEGRSVAGEMSRIALEWKPYPHVVVPRIRNWVTFPWGIVDYVRRYGFSARWRLFGTLQRLERNLQSDLVTMVIVGEPWQLEKGSYSGWAHVKILFGRLPGRGLLFVDPGHPRSARPDRLEHHGLFWQGEDEFFQQWSNLLRIFIEVEQGHIA